MITWVPIYGDAAWDPIFSPEGDKILLRSIEDNTYYRRVVPVGEFARLGGDHARILWIVDRSIGLGGVLHFYRWQPISS